MDVSEYLPMFLAEAREHLQGLNLAVVRVEEDPADRDTVDEIFRAAHSLKGMSATMGFTGVAALTHEMENVFELLRQRKGGLEREAIDVLLECLDALEAAVDAIDSDGSENLDPAALIARLQRLIRRDADEEEEKATAAAATAAETVAFDGPVVVVTATLADDAMMPAVRAFQILAAVAEHGTIVRSEPTEDGLDDFAGATITAWVETDHDPEAFVKAVSSVADVGSVTAEDVAAEAADEPAAVDAAPADPAPVAAADAAADKSPHEKKKQSSTVRVDSDRLDVLMHLMGELVVHRTHVESLVSQANIPGLAQAVQDLTRSSQALQAMVMQVRMIPVDAVFLRFPRLVRDLSSKLDKKVELVLSGRETELDRTVVDMLGDPLVHLVRNSLDHGIESPDVRVAAGKPETARLEIAARHAGGNVEISVSDDGRGIDPAAVAKKALQRGLITPEQAEAFDMRSAIEVLFAPGFSTADVTSDISGRGVGMDAVRTAIRELGGEVVLTSTPGKGTLAQIRLPLTLAIMSTLLVDAAGRPFAIPLDRVERTLRIADHVVRSVAGRQMLVERDNVFPIVDAATALGHQSTEPPTHAVLVRSGDQRIALAVDQLIGQRELVTRPLPPEVADSAAVSGGAVLSDGSIALIVDCDALSTAIREHVPRAA
jgi:two-component system, chemotaxis family, sensor kinase CheA